MNVNHNHRNRNRKRRTNSERTLWGILPFHLTKGCYVRLRKDFVEGWTINAMCTHSHSHSHTYTHFVFSRFFHDCFMDSIKKWICTTTTLRSLDVWISCFRLQNRQANANFSSRCTRFRVSHGRLRVGSTRIRREGKSGRASCARVTSEVSVELFQGRNKSGSY